MPRLTSFLRTDKDRMADVMPSGLNTPDVPGHLCIALTDRELELLGLDDDVEVGDMLHLRIMVQATAVHKSQDGCRIETAIIGGSIDDESTEGEREDEE